MIDPLLQPVWCWEIKVKESFLMCFFLSYLIEINISKVNFDHFFCTEVWQWPAQTTTICVLFM